MSASTTRRRKPRANPSRWLRDELRVEVLSGGFSDRGLPDEAELMSSFNVRRSTVREALDLLREEGLVERIRGTGTLAINQRRAGKLVEHHGVGDDLPQTLAGFSSRIIAKETIPMPAMVARHLQDEPGNPCLMVDYVGYLYGDPLGIYTNYVRYPEAEAVAKTPLSTHWYRMLDDAGLSIGETDFLIEALLADELVSTLLDIEHGSPLIGMQQVIRDVNLRPYGFAILRSRADHMLLVSQKMRPESPRTPKDL